MTVKEKILTTLVLIVALIVAGYWCYVQGRNSVKIEGIRSSTYCNGVIESEAPILALDTSDLRNGEVNRAYSTFTFYNISEESHIDIYGRMELITAHCAKLYDKDEKLFGFLTVINDEAVLATEKGETYKIKYYQPGMYISSDYTGWDDFNGMD